MDKRNQMSKLGLVCYTFGGAVGAGLFVTLPAAIETTGISIVLAIITASIVCFFAYFYDMAISSFASVKGGDYGHISFVSAPLISGVFGLTNIFYAMGNYMYAEGALTYVSYALPGIKNKIVLWTVVLLTVFSIIDYFGANLGEKVSTVMTVTLTAGILLLMVLGMSHIDFTAISAGSDKGGEAFFKNGFSGFSQAVAYCVWIVGGIGTSAVTFSRYVKKSTRVVPQAIIAVSIILGVIACLLCVVCAYAVPQEIATQGLGAVARVVMPKALFYAFAIGSGAFALLTSLQTFMAGFSAGLSAYADQGYLPRIFTKRSKNGYPWVVGIAIWLLGVIPYLFDISLGTVIAYACAPVYFCLIYVNWKCIKLPELYPDRWKKCMLHMPLGLWKALCVFSAVCATYLVYCYCAGFSLVEWGQMMLTIAFMFAWAYYRMKADHVDVAAMEKEKEDIIADAMAYED